MSFIVDGICGDLYSFRKQCLGFAILNIKFDVLSLFSLWKTPYVVFYLSLKVVKILASPWLHIIIIFHCIVLLGQCRRI